MFPPPVSRTLPVAFTSTLHILIEHHLALHSLTDLTESVTYVHLMTNDRFWSILTEGTDGFIGEYFDVLY